MSHVQVLVLTKGWVIKKTVEGIRLRSSGVKPLLPHFGQKFSFNQKNIKRRYDMLYTVTFVIWTVFVMSRLEMCECCFEKTERVHVVVFWLILHFCILSFSPPQSPDLVLLNACTFIEISYFLEAALTIQCAVGLGCTDKTICFLEQLLICIATGLHGIHRKTKY